MNRRRLLRGAGALLAAGTAGCASVDAGVPETAESAPVEAGGTDSGGGGESEGSGDESGGDPVSFADYDAVTGADGNLVVVISVANGGDDPQVRYVRAVVTADGAEFTVGEFVRVAPGETVTVELPVPVSYEAWDGSGGFTPRIVDRTPETPLGSGDAE